MGKLGYKGLLLLGGMMMLGGSGTSSVFTFFLFYGGNKCPFAVESGLAAYQRIF